MLLMIFIMACTEEAVEVNNLSRPGQYVSVRINIPGMTATTTRAADGVIESITALSFNSEGTRLGVNSVSDIKNLNADGGYNGTFNLSVPNGTTIIHFLANLPNGYNLADVTKLSDLTTLTTDDKNLTYWGVAEYTGSSLFVDLYRNMAMIAISPAVVDTDFNQFEEEELFIAGLYNANQSGTLVPYKEAFNFNLNENDYFTLPTSLNKGNIKYDPLLASTYAFEHANTRRDPLCAICKIGDYFYKVALVDDRTGEPYDIIRNHKYIIYVSDVDDYQTDEYRAGSYEGALEKEPINLNVDEVKMVSFTYNKDASLNLNNNETFSVAVDVPEVKGGSLTAIYIEADDFDVKAERGLTGPDNGVYTYTASMDSKTTLTFTPKSAGRKSIVIRGEAVNMEVPRTEISVAVNATIVATSTPENPTLYCDSENPQTVMVDVTIPKGVTALDIDADDFTVKQGETSLAYNEEKGVYTYARTDGATSETTVQFVFTLSDAVVAAKASTITFSDASGNANVTEATVSIDVKETSGTSVTYEHSKNGDLHVFNIESGGEGMASKFEVMWYSNLGWASWQSAYNTCSSINGSTDFRIPTYEEMRFLVNVNSACNLRLEDCNIWWISTKNNYYSISDDKVYTSTETITSQVRCVRTILE